MKEKLYIYALILVLMLSLVGIQNIFIDKIENRAIINNNIDGFIEYRVEDINSSISIPKEWKVTIYNDKSDTLEFSNNDNTVIGKIEIIEVTNTISEKIKGIANEKNTSMLNESWYVVKDFNDLGAKYYYIKEYSNGKLLKLTFDIKGEIYKPSITVVFDKIAESIKEK